MSALALVLFASAQVGPAAAAGLVVPGSCTVHGQDEVAFVNCLNAEIAQALEVQGADSSRAALAAPYVDTAGLIRPTDTTGATVLNTVLRAYGAQTGGGSGSMSVVVDSDCTHYEADGRVGPVNIDTDTQTSCLTGTVMLSAVKLPTSALKLVSYVCRATHDEPVAATSVFCRPANGGLVTQGYGHNLAEAVGVVLQADSRICLEATGTHVPMQNMLGFQVGAAPGNTYIPPTSCAGPIK